jgi:K+-sensing histidine kinase KdpD
VNRAPILSANRLIVSPSGMATTVTTIAIARFAVHAVARWDMMSNVDFGGARISKALGIGIGICLVLVVGAAIFPFRNQDYEFELLLVLPVVCVGALSGRLAALVTAVVAVVMFHYVTASAFERPKFDRDVIAFATFLASAAAVGIALGGRTDRLTLAAKHEEERRVRDLTEQIASKESQVALLEQVDRQRAALLRSVSHDLRTPLATIRAVATDLRDDNVHDEATRQELLDSVSNEAERLDRLVGNLLHMSRADAGSLTVQAQAVDMAELVQLTVLRMRRRCPDVTLELRVDPELPLIDGDPVLLDQVVSNLVENASRYAPPGSTVSLELGITEEPSVMLYVRDHGPGVAPEHVEKLFEPFWKEPGSRTSGLGLAIVRAIAEAHGGLIEFCETPGGGATFAVGLPARRAEQHELSRGG